MASAGGASATASSSASSSTFDPEMASAHPYPVPLYADGSSTFPSPLPPYGGGSTAKSADLGWTPPPPSAHLELAQVHFFLRHGERTPVRTRMENSSPPIPKRWNLCHASAAMRANVLQLERGEPGVETMPVQRIVEAGPSKLVPDTGEWTGECLPGELTNLGRMSSYEIGQKLRRLYVNRLGFVPETVTAQDQDLFLFRSTNMSRTIETCQQAIAGLLPSQARSKEVGALFLPRIHVRNFLTESLIPNTLGCTRFRHLDRHYAEKAATEYNPSLEALDASLSSHNDGQPIRVDGHPRLSGLLDTIRASQAHGFPVPAAFLAPETVALANRALLAEWFSGYNDPDPARALEYRRLSMGRLLSELQAQMDAKAADPDKERLRLGIYSTHDTTLAGLLSTLNVFDDRWPAFAASVNVELFRRPGVRSADPVPSTSTSSSSWSQMLSWLGFGKHAAKQVDEHYVRIRYGSETLRLPACAGAGQHLDGHAEFCTLAAFRAVVDSLKHPEGLSWEAECEGPPHKRRTSRK